MSGPPQVIRQRDFSGGQIDAEAKRRDDEPVVRAGARHAENVRIRPAGGATQRPGRTIRFDHTGRVDQVRMSPTAEYTLCFGNTTLTIRDSADNIVAQAWGYAWTLATLKDIRWDVLLDDVFICFPDQIVKVAHWDGVNGWTFFDYVPTITVGGQKRAPFYRFARRGITMALSALTGTVTVTFSDNVLVAEHVGTRFRYYDKQLTIASVATGKTGTATVSEVLRPVDRLLFTASITSVYSVGDIIEGDTGGARGYVAEVGNPANTNLTIIRLTGQPFQNSQFAVGPNGQAQLAAAGASTALTVGPAIAVWDEEVMSAYRGYPRSVAVDQSRLILMDFPSVPGGVAWSAVTDAYDLYIGAQPDEAFFELAPGKSRVFHVIPGSDEFVMTDIGVYYIPISEANPLRPGSVVFRPIAGPPSSDVEPVSTAQGVVYIGTDLNRVLAIVGTGQTAQPYLVRSASDLHGDLFHGITCIEVENGSGIPPDDRVYVLNGDGTMVVGRYQPGKEWVGWTPWSGAGTVTWISTGVGGGVLLSSTYGFGSFAEEIDSAQYLDAAVNKSTPPVALSAGAQPDVRIGDTQGTLIGDMTAGGGLAAAFDGVTGATIVTQVASATSTNLDGTITAPSTIVAGDLLVLWNYALRANFLFPDYGIPVGFTEIVNFTQDGGSGRARGIASYKIADGSEASAVLTGINISSFPTSNDLMLYVFRADQPYSIVTPVANAPQGTGGNPDAQVVNASSGTPPLIVFGCYGTTGAVDPRTFTPAKDGEINSSARSYLAYRIYNTTPADVTIDMDDEGFSNLLGSFYLMLNAPTSLNAQKNAATTSAVGKTFGQRFRIAKAEIWPSATGFTDQANVTISLRAKNGSAPVNFATNGVELATTGSIADTTAKQTLVSNDSSTEWDHAWALLTTASGVQLVTELRFYSTGITHGTGTLWFLDGATVKLMDGVQYLGARAVTAGAVVSELGDDFSSPTIVLGQDWTFTLEPFLPHVQSGQDVGQLINGRALVHVAVAVQDSTGFRVEKLNPKTQAWEKTNDVFTAYRVNENEDVAPIVREEANKVSAGGTEYDPRIRVVKDYPGPLKVLEISTQVGA